ncbi:MAG: rhodanese-like domain-containing protein [Ferruginibacter sp.]
MLSRILPAIFLLSVFSAKAQYKNDNVLYKTIEWTNLCNELQNNPGYLLLDVRTTGEFNDTSDYINAGHIKGAENISSREIGNRLSEITSYKNKPVFVYCSHSQRSRRVSKMLADSGFTKIYNINGGITALYYSNAKDNTCLQQLVVTKNKYTIISATDMCKKLANDRKNIFILDVRSDSAFRHITQNPRDNAMGTIKGSVNIQVADIDKEISRIPANKEILVVDMFGQEAARAATLLKQHGFEKVITPIEGIDRWLSADNSDTNCVKINYVSPAKYKLINSVAFGNKVRTDKNILLLDIRTAEEFNNKHKDAWRNIGHIKNAVNIPLDELNTRVAEINNYKNKAVLIYDFGGDEEAFEAAQKLTQLGFTDVQVLLGGIFNVRWTAANRNISYLKELVTDVPDNNQ